MPAVSWSVRGKLNKIKWFKRLVVQVYNCFTLLVKLPGTVYLTGSYCSKNIWQIKFITGCNYVIFPRSSRTCVAIPGRAVHSVHAHNSHTSCKIRVAGTDHATFCCCNCFRYIKGENSSISDCSGIAKLCWRRKAVCGIFYNSYCVVCC